jgi:hypothetical protein
MASSRWKGESGPMSLRNPSEANLHLIVWCRACQHRIEYGPDELAQFAERYGEDLPVYRWLERLACTECGARDADFVVSGAKR